MQRATTDIYISLYIYTHRINIIIHYVRKKTHGVVLLQENNQRHGCDVVWHKAVTLKMLITYSKCILKCFIPLTLQ